MIKKSAYVLLFTLILTTAAQAITITSDIDTDLGEIAAGSTITFNLTASGYEEDGTRASDIVWQMKSNEGANPGFRLNKRRGDSVQLSVSELARTGRDGVFSITVSAQGNGTATITITGRTVNKPEILTEAFENAQAGSERRYIQRLEFNPGVEPLELELSGNVPEGLDFSEITAGGRLYHVVTGDIETPGTYSFTLTARNPVGYAKKNFTLQVGTTEPRIKSPKDFPREYIVYAGRPFYIDLNRFQFIGTKPLKIYLDDKSTALGLSYDYDNATITGTIPSGTKTRKHNVILRAANDYGKTVSTSFTLNIKSSASGFKLVPTNNRIQHFTGNPELYVVPVHLGRVFHTQFKAEAGTSPITWDYEITSMDDSINGKMIVKDLGGKFGGLVFSSDGSITGTPKGRGNIIFVAEASNPAGVSRSQLYDFVFGSAPVFDGAKISKHIMLVNGRSTSINVADYLIPSENGRLTDTFTVEGSFPPGMSFNGTAIKGIPMALDASHFTRYALDISAANAFGTAYNRLIFNLVDVPVIGEIPEVVTGKVGRNFGLTLPTNARIDHTWRLEYNGEEVADEVGDSGIQWNAKAARLSGLGKSILEGTYEVTAYLTSELGEDSKTFTIKINK